MKNRLILFLAIIVLWGIPGLHAKKRLYNTAAAIPGLTVIDNAHSGITPACVYFRNNVDGRSVEFDGQMLPDPYAVIALSYHNLNVRVLESNSRERKEKSNVMQLGSYDLVENFPMRNSVLASNYVMVINRKKGSYLWRLYQIVTPYDAAQTLELNGGKVGDLQLSYKLVDRGKLKVKWEMDKLQDKLAKQCPLLAMAAPVVKVKSHNTATRLGTKDLNFSKGDRFIAYMTKLNEKTMMPYSQKVGIFRAVKISEGSMRDTRQDSTLYFQIAGGKVRPGDVMVYSPDKKQSTAISGTLQKDVYGFRIDYDNLTNITRMGFTGYFMSAIGLNFTRNGWEEIGLKSNGSGSDYTKKLLDDYRAMIPWFSVGWGLGFNFWHALELRPYLGFGMEVPIFFGDQYPSKNIRLNFIGTIGARFIFNIAYPFQFMAGLEYRGNAIGVTKMSLEDIGTNVRPDPTYPSYPSYPSYPNTQEETKKSSEEWRFCSTFSAYAGFRWCF